MPGLTVSQTWEVGLVGFIRAALEQSWSSRHGAARPDLPDRFQEASDQTAADLERWAVAEVEVSGGIDEAILLIEEKQFR